MEKNGYHTARVSKIYHMRVGTDIYQGTNGSDDARSWHERHNVKAAEWFTKGAGKLLERNPKGQLPIKKGNFLQYVKGEDENDRIYADALAANKACKLIESYNRKPGKPFFLAVGFVRPHVPFVAPASYFAPYPPETIKMPPRVPNDIDDIPRAGRGQFTSKERKITPKQEKEAVAAYYATVSYMDAQVGKLLDTLEKEGLSDDTVVIFTSDHGYHIGEHGMWMKVDLHENAVRVPLIIKVPGKKTAICNSITELVDLYPTTSAICGLEIPKNLQGKNIAKTLDDPNHKVRDAAFSLVKEKEALLRTENWAYMEYGDNGKAGIELYDMKKDPHQFTNLAGNPEYATKRKELKARLAEKKASVRNSDIRKK